MLLVIGYIGYALRRQRHDFLTVWQYWTNAPWLSASALLLLALTPLNWTLEALKWKILVHRIEPISLGEALSGVLAGLSLGFALPAQMGDTAGRILSLRSDRRWQSIGASLVSGGMQFYVALVFGFLALLLAKGGTSGSYAALSLLLGACTVLGLVVAVYRRRLLTLNGRWLRKWERYWAVAGYYSGAELWLGLGAAALRYLTFSVQFYLALQLFEVRLPIRETAAGIGLVYLGKTLVPAFNLLSDLGVREAASLWIFGQWQVPAPQILSATLTLWLINILLPVLVGLVWVWKLKLSPVS